MTLQTMKGLPVTSLRKAVGIEKGEAHPILRVHDLLITTEWMEFFLKG